MHMLYDTRRVHPLDRYDHYRDGAAAEVAPVVVPGRSPNRLFATMLVAQVGEFSIDRIRWSADVDVVARRTGRLIRAGDPECYRIFVDVSGSVIAEQAGNQACFHPGDIGLYDTSLPWRSTHLTGPEPMGLVMLTFPRALVPVSPAAIRPLVGTATPRNMPGRDVIAEFLVGLTDSPARLADPVLPDVLRECAIGLVRQRLGQPNGITPQTRRLLRIAHIRGVIRRTLGDPALDADKIARIANISPRYLHKLLQGTGLTPMQLVKQFRLEECHRRLRDPALAATPVRELARAQGYLRADQFARDFRQLFGVSATEVRRSARERLSGHEE